MVKFNEQVKDFDLEFDFDMLVMLAENDPDDFEDFRQELINDYIKSLPQERQHRMECLQWRIDGTRNQSKNALSACMAITEMMWQSFEQLNTLFMEMKNPECRVKVSAVLQSADILPFKPV
ncbi:MAG: DUF3135 domain-containing protein [Thiohalomonadales bacterium]